MSEEKLTSFLKTAKDWSRFRTSVPGVFVLKIPKYRNAPPRLAVELNPVDDYGKPKKRRGLILRTSGELADFREVLQYDRLEKLLGILDEVNPKVEGKRPGKGEEVIEL